MKTWINRLSGEKFEMDDRINISSSIAIEIKSPSSKKIDDEVKIQQEIDRLIRDQAIKNLGL